MRAFDGEENERDTDGGAEEEEWDRDEDEEEIMKGEDEEKEGGPGPCATGSKPGGRFVIRGSPALALARKRSPEPGTDTQAAVVGGGESGMMKMVGAEGIGVINYFEVLKCLQMKESHDKPEGQARPLGKEGAVCLFVWPRRTLRTKAISRVAYSFFSFFFLSFSRVQSGVRAQFGKSSRVPTVCSVPNRRVLYMCLFSGAGIGSGR